MCPFGLVFKSLCRRQHYVKTRCMQKNRYYSSDDSIGKSTNTSGSTNTYKSLSFTRVSCYLSCPLRFKYAYIDNISQEPSASMIIGKSLHAAIDRFATHIIENGIENLANSSHADYSVKSDKEYKEYLLSEMLQVFRKELDIGEEEIMNSAGKNLDSIKSTFDKESHMKSGSNILRSFLEREIESGAFLNLGNREKREKDLILAASTPNYKLPSTYRYPILSEEPFELELSEKNELGETIIFKGTWDRIDRQIINLGKETEREINTIVEYKTKLSEFSPSNYFLQIIFYMYAYFRIFESLPEQIMLCSITEDINYKWSSSQLMSHINNVEKILLRVSDSIRRNDFTAKPDNCRFCPFRFICPQRQ